MPDDFPDKDLAGKTVIYNIKIKKILIGKLPALDKDFFSNLGISTEDDSVFRDSVKTHMNFELKDKLVSKKYSLVNEQLINAFEFDLPNSLVIKHEANWGNICSFKQANDDVDEKIKDIAIKRKYIIQLAKEIQTN